MTDREARKWAALLISTVTEGEGTAAFLALQEAVNGQSRGVICMAAAMLLAQQIAGHDGSSMVRPAAAPGGGDHADGRFHRAGGPRQDAADIA